MTSGTDRYDLSNPLDEERADWLLDLYGFLVVREAVRPGDVAAIDAWIDDHVAAAQGQVRSFDEGDGHWIGGVETQTYDGVDGLNFQNIVVAGEPFSGLIDHPSWIRHCRRWVNDHNGLMLYENFLNVREQGGYFPLHGGGAWPHIYMSVRHATTSGWLVGQVNVILAVNDIGPEDGPTVMIPGSHKSSLRHEDLRERIFRSDARGLSSSDLIEVHLAPGDALLFTDAMTHAAQVRRSAGDRRSVILRYSPACFANRYNYVYRESDLDVLSESQRLILQPTRPRHAPQ